ncbi:carbon-nitrogen hydrolase family protein [Kocuria sp. JC486]|uniref:Carbon-nitrogen hydrolase family protein n=1 Tax=Kocuria soli TaxID=2485125 RepID=A0A3N3ZSH7_9MICC|nr:MULTISPECIES: carbon-nitrogen hydrolase family protein [Kocuria]NHU85543.1 carbon-nitrogen hydrolase family protein [Kocuria sp. JC486]ROZ64416.1 carbon-nitrogen hydrolase family protein [Kocuria soli]
MKISIAQLNSTPDVDQNLECVLAAVAQAAGDGADLVVFPEAAACSFDGKFADFARTSADRFHKSVQDASDQHGVAVILGSFTPSASDERTANTLFVFRPGQDPVTYDKIHLFDAFGFKESKGIVPGSTPVSVDVGGTQVGLAICYDLRFPELFTRLARDGAQVVVVIASWGDGPGKARQWDLLTRARALDSTSYVVACGQAVRDLAHEGEATKTPLGVGHSAVIAPDGSDVVRLDGGEDQVTVDLDLAQVTTVRDSIPVLANNRL